MAELPALLKNVDTLDDLAIYADALTCGRMEDRAAERRALQDELSRAWYQEEPPSAGCLAAHSQGDIKMGGL